MEFQIFYDPSVTVATFSKRPPRSVTAPRHVWDEMLSTVEHPMVPASAQKEQPLGQQRTIGVGESGVQGMPAHLCDNDRV